MRIAIQSVALVPFLVAGVLAPAPAQPSTVILVRHAEKAASPADDPGLTPAGVQRARDLATALADARVGSIITTQFERTRATAAPLAQAIGTAPMVVSAGSSTGTHAAEVAAAVRARPPGDVVLVVGHSNTIPAIIEALGGPRLPDLCDAEYSTILVLDLRPQGLPALVRARFGAPDPPDAGNCTPSMRSTRSRSARAAAARSKMP